MLKHSETCFFGVQSTPFFGFVGPLVASGFPKDSVFSRVDWCGASEQCNQMRKDDVG